MQSLKNMKCMHAQQIKLKCLLQSTVSILFYKRISVSYTLSLSVIHIGDNYNGDNYNSDKAAKSKNLSK